MMTRGCVWKLVHTTVYKLSQKMSFFHLKWVFFFSFEVCLQLKEHLVYALL